MFPESVVTWSHSFGLEVANQPAPICLRLDLQIEDEIRPRPRIAVGPFDGNQTRGDQAFRPAQGIPIPRFFQSIEIPVFKRQFSSGQRLAKGEGRTGDVPLDSKSGGQTPNPFGFSCSQWSMQADDCSRLQGGEEAGGMGPGFRGTPTYHAGGGLSESGHSPAREGRLFRTPGLLGASDRFR